MGRSMSGRPPGKFTPASPGAASAQHRPLRRACSYDVDGAARAPYRGLHGPQGRRTQPRGGRASAPTSTRCATSTAITPRKPPPTPCRASPRAGSTSPARRGFRSCTRIATAGNSPPCSPTPRAPQSSGESTTGWSSYFCDDDQEERQSTVVTETSGPQQGRRLVRAARRRATRARTSPSDGRGSH